MHNKIFSHFKPMKTWLILTWGGWKSKWGKEFFLPWGQQNFIQGQPAPHKYGTIPHQQRASCIYTTNTGMSLSTNTQNTTSTSSSNTELTAAFSTSAVYRSLSGITCIHHTPIKRHLKTKPRYTNTQESYTNTQENYTNTQASYTNTQCRFGKVSAVQPSSHVSPASEAKLTFTCQHVQ